MGGNLDAQGDVEISHGTYRTWSGISRGECPRLRGLVNPRAQPACGAEEQASNHNSYQSINGTTGGSVAPRGPANPGSLAGPREVGLVVAVVKAHIAWG